MSNNDDPEKKISPELFENERKLQTKEDNFYFNEEEKKEEEKIDQDIELNPRLEPYKMELEFNEPILQISKFNGERELYENRRIHNVPGNKIYYEKNNRIGIDKKN
jgi:hypothetical protein